MRTGTTLLALAVPAMVLVGCQQQPVSGDLGAEEAPRRIPALVGAANSTDDAELAAMVHALMDDDPAVRLFAIQALHDRTGQTLGYKYYAPAEERSAAAQRWREWLPLEEDRRRPPRETESETDNPSTPRSGEQRAQSSTTPND